MEHKLPNSELTVADILKGHPQPWGVTRGDRTALNETGLSALSLILLLHDGCVDCDKARQVQNNKKLFMQELAAGAAKFIEQHREHSCVPDMPATALVLLMTLFKIDCLYKAGVVDQEGEYVQ